MVLTYQILSLKNLDGEEWRDIDGLEGFYQISNLGRVKSLARMTQGKIGLRTIKERILIQKLDKKRKICTVRLQMKESYYDKTIPVRRLVAAAFLRQEGCVTHKDLDFTNSHASNLQVVANQADVAKITKDKKLSKRYSKYRGVSKIVIYTGYTYYTLTMKFPKHYIRESFEDEKEAAKKYDYYIQKFNLNRKGNFI